MSRPFRVLFQRMNQSTELSRSEEHTSELQSQSNLVCRLLLEKKNKSEVVTSVPRVPDLHCGGRDDPVTLCVGTGPVASVYTHPMSGLQRVGDRGLGAFRQQI